MGRKVIWEYCPIARARARSQKDVCGHLGKDSFSLKSRVTVGLKSIKKYCYLCSICMASQFGLKSRGAGCCDGGWTGKAGRGLRDNWVGLLWCVAGWWAVEAPGGTADSPCGYRAD